ncbi:MAG: UDP-N-acetylmuramoyl-tripeptide--D-alanyl-D-alanine ligase [Bacillota bacterium]|nr:UDP-N-acetylmuramoyl-tripeptide--D-alanyl-D-alanine ligase [Bacillota bacterium]
MRSCTLGEIAAAVGGVLKQGAPGRVVSRVATDTRALCAGSLFFALRGERFDGHDFAGRAAEAGAAGVVVSREVELPPSAAVLVVKDTLAALQALAAWNRSALDMPIVAVTGSTGKTTTKDLIAAVLGRRWPVVATRGNFNNEIGVPLTLLDLDENTGAAVVEMGMRGPGEIDFLSRLVKPLAAVITNIGEAHIERLGTVENIARAKGEVLEHLPPEGFALLHAGSPYLRGQARRTPARVLYFGEDPGADYALTAYRPEAGGCVFEASCRGRRHAFRLALAGKHQALNALAAVGTGMELGLGPAEVAEGLAEARLSPMRQAVVRAGDLTVINDAYNANPASMKAALGLLGEMAGGRPRVVVLGDMLELGSRALGGHREVGAACAALGLDLLVTVGERARLIAEGAREAGMDPARIVCCTANPQAVAALRERLSGREMVLVKGSRGMRMEEIVTALAETDVGRRTAGDREAGA